MLPDGRVLTEAQHSRLDKLADKEPEATVVGWEADGPIVAYEGNLRRVNPLGRLSKVSWRVRLELAV